MDANTQFLLYILIPVRASLRHVRKTTQHVGIRGMMSICDLCVTGEEQQDAKSIKWNYV